MDPQMQILVFSISGTLEMPGRKRSWWQPTRAGNGRIARDDASVRPEAEPTVDSEAVTVRELSDRADEIAHQIEREIRQIVPPASGITPQVEISFSRGSVVLEGTVLLLGWAGGIALEAFRTEMAELIKVAVRRVVGDAIAGLRNQNPTIPVMSMAMAVTPTRSRTTPPTSQPSVIAAGETSRRIPLDWSQILLILLTALFVFDLVMDRYFPPPARYLAPTSPTPASPQNTSPPPSR